MSAKCLNCTLLDKDLRCEIYYLPRVTGLTTRDHFGLHLSHRFPSFKQFLILPDLLCSSPMLLLSLGIASSVAAALFCSLSTTTMTGWLANSCLTVRNLKSLRMLALLFSTNFLWFTRCSTCTGSVGV